MTAKSTFPERCSDGDVADSTIVSTSEEADTARAWLRRKGFDVVVEERDLREELMRTGFAGFASENQTHWADLV